MNEKVELKLLKGKKIVLAVTGGIAAYRSIDVANGLIKKGAEVRVVMTQAACGLVSPNSFAAITKQRVALDSHTLNPSTDVSMEHISLADWGNCLLVCPATANVLGKTAQGIADDLLSTTVMTMHDRLIFAPAMNTRMWQSPATQNNISLLKQRNIKVVGPIAGSLACGDSGEGHIASINDILLAVESFLMKRSSWLKEKKIVVTGGRTRTSIDPVRYMTNHSSGRMGVALARAALSFSDDVVFVHGDLDVEVPSLVNPIHVSTNEEMLHAIQKELNGESILMMAAAPVDFQVQMPGNQKIKKGDLKNIELKDNIDILGALKDVPVPKIGFALETEKAEEYGREKLEKKGLQYIAVNRYEPGITGFHSTTNKLIVLSKDERIELPLMNKEELAYALWDIIAKERVDA
jgi:phosphopantothenoylcysteine decarboxylase/phosphopantothenate--cysteine ligase